jgi:hypothetical protein
VVFVRKALTAGTGVPRRLSIVVTRTRTGRTEIIQLSAASAELVALCGWARNAGAVAEASSGSHPSVEGVRGHEVGLVGLELLRQRGLLTMMSPWLRSLWPEHRRVGSTHCR